MSLSMYTASVPVFQHTLKAMSAFLSKAEAHAEANKFAPEALLQSRLFPNMFALTKQVQVAYMSKIFRHQGCYFLSYLKLN